MRKILLLMLFALCLSACGAPGAGEGPAPTPAETPVVAETPAPTPVPTPEPALSLLPDAGPLPDYIPPMGFEPVSVWEAEPFGDGGQALLYMGEETDGVTPFKVFSCFSYDTSEYLDTNSLLSTRSFSARADAAGEFSVDCGKEGRFLEPVLALSKLEGRIELSGGTLALSYTEHSLQPWADGLNSLSVRLEGWQPRIDTGTASIDSVQYLPTAFKRLPDEAMGRAMYSMPVFEEEIRAEPGSLRGLSAGSSYMDVISRIPCPIQLRRSDPRSITAPSGWYESYYGSEAGTAFATLNYRDGRPYELCICNVHHAAFYLDEELNVTEVHTGVYD